MKENQIFVKKNEIFYKRKPSLSIAQVQITDKNLHPSVYSAYYSRGRKRERERERERIVPNLESGRAGATAWMCWSWSVGVLREGN
jgi:hypothetical protein